MALGEVESKVFELITNNDLYGLKNHLSLNKIKIDILDEHGMTPLTHACFKGNYEISQYLLDQGADVNTLEHEHRYSALHFAALSGNAKLCQLLLDAGAKSHRVNSVGRTAPQMAAFVGNHQCVAIINNYIPKSEIDYYTVPHGVEKDPKLPPELASALHKLVMHVNLHPVRVVLNLLPALYEDMPSVKWTLELMSQKEMTRGAESNEVTSFKLHYLSCIIGGVIKRKMQGVQTVIDKCEAFIRMLLKPETGEKYMDSIIVDCVREFPYTKSTLFQQMVSSLASGKDAPSPLSVIITAINGQRGFTDNVKSCATCAEETATKTCANCKQIHYCDKECQRLHWFVHKKTCSKICEDNTAISKQLENMKVSQD